MPAEEWAAEVWIDSAIVGRVLGLWEAPPHVEAMLREAATLPPAPGLTVAHGDLHLRHLLVGSDGIPTGVVDWDDICRADPAVDRENAGRLTYEKGLPQPGSPFGPAGGFVLRG